MCVFLCACVLVLGTYHTDRFALLPVHGLCSLLVIEGGMAVDGQGPVLVCNMNTPSSHCTPPHPDTTLVVTNLSVIFLEERH